MATGTNTIGHAVMGQNATDDGAFDSVNHKVKWGQFFDNSQRTLVYTATSPNMESGSKTFVGTASFDSVNVQIAEARTICPAITVNPSNSSLSLGRAGTASRPSRKRVTQGNSISASVQVRCRPSWRKTQAGA